MSLPPKGSKVALKEHLKIVWRNTKKKPKPLAEQPELPPELAHLWAYYCEIADGEKLSYTEIRNWSDLTNRNITAFEVTVLKKLNHLYLKIVSERHV